MGLSEKEEIGIRGILAFMDPSSVGPLLSTITNGIVKSTKPQGNDRDDFVGSFFLLSVYTLLVLIISVFFSCRRNR